MTAGMTLSPISLVFSLNCLQKSIRFSPCGPRTVPIGGAGLALPAGTCRFKVVFTFLAIRLRSPLTLRHFAHGLDPAYRRTSTSRVEKSNALSEVEGLLNYQ